MNYVTLIPDKTKEELLLNKTAQRKKEKSLRFDDVIHDVQSDALRSDIKEPIVKQKVKDFPKIVLVDSFMSKCNEGSAIRK